MKRAHERFLDSLEIFYFRLHEENRSHTRKVSRRYFGDEDAFMYGSFLYGLLRYDIDPLDFARAAAKLRGEQTDTALYLKGWLLGDSGREDIIEVLKHLE